MKPNEFLNQPDTRVRVPLLVLTGDEPWFMEQIVDRVARAWGRETERFSGGDATLADVLDACRNPSLFGPKPVVVVREAGPLLAGDNRDGLLRYAAGPATDTSLILCTAKLDGRTAAAKALKKHGVLVACERLYDHPPPWELHRPPHDHPIAHWIVAELERRGRRCRLEVAHALCQLVGSELTELSGAIERLCAANPDAAMVEEAEVRAQFLTVRRFTAFDLAEALARGETAMGLTILERLLVSGAYDERSDKFITAAGVWAQLTLGSLRRSLEQVHQLRMAPAGLDRNELASLLGIRPFLLPRLQHLAHRLSGLSMLEAFDALCRADMDLKLSRRSARAVILDCMRLFAAPQGPAPSERREPTRRYLLGRRSR